MNYIKTVIARIRARIRGENVAGAMGSGCWIMTIEGCLFADREWKQIKDVFTAFNEETKHRLTFAPEPGRWSARAKFWARELRPRLTPELYHKAMLKLCGWYADCARMQINKSLALHLGG